MGLETSSKRYAKALVAYSIDKGTLDTMNDEINSLINISDSNNIPFRWSYKVVDKADHDYLKMTPVAAKILLEDVSSFD